MKTYLEFYRERLINNDKMLNELAYKLIDMGMKVFKSRSDRLLNGYTIYNPENNAHLHFYFSEVPYRWSASISWKPSRETGSGKTVKEWYDINSTPGIDEIISLMHPYYLNSYIDNQLNRFQVEITNNTNLTI